MSVSNIAQNNSCARVSIASRPMARSSRVSRSTRRDSRTCGQQACPPPFRATVLATLYSRHTNISRWGVDYDAPYRDREGWTLGSRPGLRVIVFGHARFDRRALRPASQVTSGAGLSQRYPAVSCSWSATTRTGVGTMHTFSQLGLRILDRDDVPPCDVLALARWPGSSDPT
jgi:hypothetical protein